MEGTVSSYKVIDSIDNKSMTKYNPFNPVIRFDPMMQNKFNEDRMELKRISGILLTTRNKLIGVQYGTHR